MSYGIDCRHELIIESSAPFMKLEPDKKPVNDLQAQDSPSPAELSRSESSGSQPTQPVASEHASLAQIPPAVAASHRSQPRTEQRQSQSHPAPSRHTSAVKESRSGRRDKPRRSDSRSDSVFSRLTWFFASAAMVLCIWRIGPEIMESYYYAAAKGEARGEYENALELLKDDPLGGVSQAYELVAQKIRPSVVSVQATKPKGRSANTGRVKFLESGQGSGVIMSEEGYILTNEHVIRGSTNILVTLSDRRVYEAELVGVADKYNDLAVLKIEANDLVPAQWGDSDRLDVGSIVWAVGSPYGLDQTVTSGIISAKNRYNRTQPQQELLQTDAAVNPGNSGGPLVDAKGRVVGINTSIYGDQFQGISFAVPSVQAKFVYEQTLSKRHVARGFLGAEPTAVYQRDAEELGLPDIQGAKLSRIEYNSPAMRSGLRLNDVVRSWNGQHVDDFHKLYRFVSMTEPDSIAEVEIIRDGQPRVLDVQVGSRKAILGNR